MERRARVGYGISAPKYSRRNYLCHIIRKPNDYYSLDIPRNNERPENHRGRILFRLLLILFVFYDDAIERKRRNS